MAEALALQDTPSERLLILLQKEHESSGYLSEAFLTKMSQELNISLGEVYGIATFYHFLSTEELGRNVIWVCKSIPCYLKDSQFVIETLRRELGIGPGETTPDKQFSLRLTNCIGACDHAPAMMINHHIYGDLTPERISTILKSCR